MALPGGTQGRVVVGIAVAEHKNNIAAAGQGIQLFLKGRNFGNQIRLPAR